MQQEAITPQTDSPAEDPPFAEVADPTVVDPSSRESVGSSEWGTPAWVSAAYERATARLAAQQEAAGAAPAKAEPAGMVGSTRATGTDETAAPEADTAILGEETVPTAVPSTGASASAYERTMVRVQQTATRVEAGESWAEFLERARARQERARGRGQGQGEGAQRDVEGAASTGP